MEEEIVGQRKQQAGQISSSHNFDDIRPEEADEEVWRNPNIVTQNHNDNPLLEDTAGLG